MHYPVRNKLLLFLLLFLVLHSCVSVDSLNQSLERPHIDIGVKQPLKKPFAHLSLPQGIVLDTVLAPKGFPKQSFAYKTGGLVLPLLFYDQFQSNFMITLGSKQFNTPVDESFRQRFNAMLSSCTNPSQKLTATHTLSMELQVCEAQGIFVHGSWVAFYGYGSASGEINHGRNATAIVRIRWVLAKGEETLTTGDVYIQLKDPYLGHVAGHITSHGRRQEISKNDLNYEIPFQIESEKDPYLNLSHINQMVQVMCLSLDKASEIVLTDLQSYFSGTDAQTR